MTKNIRYWRCQPCEYSSKEGQNEICLICEVDGSKTKIKIIKKSGQSPYFKSGN